MREWFKTYPGTTAGLLVGASLFAFSLFLDLDIFEVVIQQLHQIEHFELDELVLPLAFLFVGSGVDMYRKYANKREAVLVAETRLHSLQAMMRSVQDIVGNSMNNLLVYTLEAKDAGKLSERSIEEIEALIQETTSKINQLSRLENLSEDEVAEGLFVLKVGAEDSDRSS